MASGTVDSLEVLHEAAGLYTAELIQRVHKLFRVPLGRRRVELSVEFKNGAVASIK
jgi:hypothetical protein